jgi:hypothetical protein
MFLLVVAKTVGGTGAVMRHQAHVFVTVATLARTAPTVAACAQTQPIVVLLWMATLAADATM